MFEQAEPLVIGGTKGRSVGDGFDEGFSVPDHRFAESVPFDLIRFEGLCDFLKVSDSLFHRLPSAQAPTFGKSLRETSV